MLGRFKEWLPAESIRLMREWSGLGVRFEGEYLSWDQAARKAQGYDAAAILEQVYQATLAVRDGRAAFERDGVLFSEPDFPYPLLAGLLRVAALDGGHLDVLDFGGALGSSYFQCRPWLSDLKALRWRVVEQPNYVKLGRERLADGILGFIEHIEECAAGGLANVVILSGVLQYLPNPGDLLAKIAELRIRHVIIDRTPVIMEERNVLAVQVVPARIVRSSYPVRLFSQNSVLQPLEKKYRILSEFPAVDGVLGGMRRRVEFKGFILERKADGDD
jgi:putative methyltransferase (TIGR04325 family)